MNATIALFRDVAFGSLEPFKKSRFEILVENFFGQLNRTRGVLDDLHAFDSGDLVKEPAATGVHQHGMPLQFHAA